MCKENKRKKKKKVKQKERKEKVSPRKTNRLRFERSSCTIQALMYCKCGHWLLRFDLRRLLLCAYPVVLIYLKKYTPNCFSRQAETKEGSNVLLGYTNIRLYFQKLPAKFSVLNCSNQHSRPSSIQETY